MSPYLVDLRTRIGTDLVLLPAVAVWVFDPDGRVLLCKNQGQDCWEAVGGMVEPDEHPIMAAARELHEETGLIADTFVLLGTVGGPDYRVIYANGDQVSYVTSVYRVELDTNRAAPVPDGKEVTDLGWFEPEEIATDSFGVFVRSLFRDITIAPTANGRIAGSHSPLVTIDKSAAQPPHAQVTAQITNKILAGTLRVGIRLPTVRQLADEINLAPNTVARCYRDLESAGLIETRGRHGTFVARR